MSDDLDDIRRAIANALVAHLRVSCGPSAPDKFVSLSVAEGLAAADVALRVPEVAQALRMKRIGPLTEEQAQASD